MGNNECPTCLELKNVIKRFSGVTAVDDVSLKVEDGSIFSLLGPSGCGKTTALRLVAGFETPDAGEILINNKVVNDIPAHKRDCSMVFQTLALFPHMTVAENIAYGLERRRVGKAEIKMKVREMLELIQLTGLEKRRPSQLSGGQRQRVALARSLVLHPNILLLDEPLAALDRKLRKEMQLELKQIQREVGITFLYVTHDQKEALSLSDAIAVMNKGKLVQVGSPMDIYEKPKTRFIADFMGGSNIFPGRGVANGDGKVQVETNDGLRLMACVNKETHCDKVTGVSVHAELMNVLPACEGKGRDNEFTGRVVEMVYQGDFIETKVCLDMSGGFITSHLSSSLGRKLQLCIGEEVIVYWDLESSNILTG
jgi:spermidine/putrescine transport system ATP-binding protein